MTSRSPYASRDNPGRLNRIRSWPRSYPQLLIACLFFAGGLVHGHEVPTSTLNGARAYALTQSLIEGSARFAGAASADRRRLESDLIATAAARFQILASMMEDDPGAVLDVSLPAAIRSRMPSSVALYLEQDVEVDGTLEILHEDWPIGARYRYFLYSPRGRYALHFAERSPDHLLTGARIRVSGIQVGTMLALGGGAASVQQVAAAPSAQTVGEQRTIVILVNFADAPVQPYTPDSVRTMMFAGDGYTINHFYLENSFQQTWLIGDVAGWFTISATSTACDTTAMADQAQAAATAAGFDLSGYAHQIIAFPENAACGWAGLSSVGGNPSQSWINSINGSFQTRVVAHELGHGMGLWHSHGLDCGIDVLGTNCSSAEYGDVVDTMGGPIGFAPAAHFNSFQKERLGWLNAGISPPITTVVSSGTYTLDPYETLGTGPKALKILKSTDPTTGYRTWYYVEYRQAIGFDAFLSSLPSNILNGVLIRVGSETSGNTSNLLDLVPSTDSWWDAALVGGQSFQDPQAAVTITTSWIGAAQAGVSIVFGAVAAPPPGSLGITLSTDQSTYTRNQPISMKATVTAGAVPVASVPVTFTVAKPTGGTVTGTVTTGSNGVAVYKLRLRKQDATGTYRANAIATDRSLTGMATTIFTVQ